MEEEVKAGIGESAQCEQPVATWPEMRALAGAAVVLFLFSFAALDPITANKATETAAVQASQPQEIIKITNVDIQQASTTPPEEFAVPPELQ